MSREAMQMALEALESDPTSLAWLISKKQAITALRKALVDADDTSEKHVDEMVKTEHDKQIEIAQAYERGWNAALAQQEPVAWITDGGKGELWWYQSSKFDEEGNLIGPNPDDIPLYTAPPKREWVGLTDEEIDTAWRSVDYTVSYEQFRIDIAHTIEAKLKEKNG